MAYVGNFENINLYKYSKETKSKPFLLFGSVQQNPPLQEGFALIVSFGGYSNTHFESVNVTNRESCHKAGLKSWNHIRTEYMHLKLNHI